MRLFYTFILLIASMCAMLFSNSANSQTGVLNPDDPIVVYNAAAPPATPAFGTLAKWVKTNRLGFNTSSFKSYFYKGVSFRLKFPKSYKDSLGTGKKYPIFVFFHGIGEKGTIYDNEYQLYHGGQHFMNAVDAGRYDGFLLYPQTSSGSGAFNATHYNIVNELISNYFVPQVNVDINRVTVDGLSGGGGSTWQMLRNHPKLVAGGLPISAVSVADGDGGMVNSLRFTPIWLFQGYLDNAPHFNTARNVVNNYRNAGSNIQYKEYPDQGHGCWNSAWNEAGFFPFINNAHKANPWPLFGRTEYCPGETINATMGVTAGFDGYEWRRNGTLISGANAHTYTATTVGKYECRIRRGTEWSVWSPTPVELKLKGATISPEINISGSFSKAIPSPAGNTTVTLEVPAGYTSYEWQRDGSTTILGTTRTLSVSTAGSYKVKVTEEFGCSSDFSTLFNVVNANGTNAPPAITNLTATVLSKTSVRLDWAQVAAPTFNETGFEVYRSTNAASGFSLVHVTASNIGTYTDLTLNSNTQYYYKIRAINNNAASAVSETVNGTTMADVTPPTAPANLTKISSTRNSVSLIWDQSTDDVGVVAYDIYVNNIKYYETTENQFTVYNLQHGQTYAFRVKARDFANNASPFSNQVTSQAMLNGLTYKYYTFTGTWNNLPDFNALDPVATGQVPNVTLSNRTQDDNFAYLWEGFITIPTTGSYTFRTNSDDGSKLYLSNYSFAATALVNNDGLHGAQDRDGTITLTAGTYPIAITFYEQAGGEVMNVSWRVPGSTSFVAIPNSAFSDAIVVDGLPPAKPSNLTATAVSHKQINLQWADNSTNETGFEIWRSTNQVEDFVTIGNAAANATTFSDTTLSAATTYYYRVKAIGQYGESAFDKEGGGIDYSYYQVDALSVLPNFNALTPVKTGRVPNFTLEPRNRADNFQFKFSGFIRITTPGTYTFFTSSDDGSKLYIGGFTEGNLVVNNDGLHGTQERSGTRTLTAGLHPIFVTFFERDGGETLEVRYSGPSVAKQLIPSSVLGDALVNATTLAAPQAPQAPTSLLATGLSTGTINVTWNNPSALTTTEIYRSANNNSSFVLLTTIAANTNSYLDEGLNANAVFYYKAKAVNSGIASVFSNEDSAKTKNNAPSIVNIENRSMRYGTNLSVGITATDVDADALTFSTLNLPLFGQLVPNAGSYGVADIIFTPTISNVGTYNDIKVIVSDANGGSDTTSFNLIVSANHQPVINSATNNVSLKEKETSQIAINVVDEDASDEIEWSFVGLPSFVNTQISGRSVQLNLTPGYADKGDYTIEVTANDGNGGVATRSIVINVVDVNPNKTVYVNFGDATIQAGLPWNNTAQAPSLSTNLTSLLDDKGNATTIGVQLTSAWAGSNNAGSNTGNNSGVYPDPVLRSSYFTGTTSTFRVYGLTTTDKYSLSFLGSRAAPTVGVVTTYTIGSQTLSLNAANNTQNVVTFNDIVPASDGSIVVTVSKATGSMYGYLNSMVLTSKFDDGSVPAKPRNLTATKTSNAVSLNWVDAAYNETGYEIYKASTLTGTYTLLNTSTTNVPDIEQFEDTQIASSNTYFYTIRAKNSYGNSPYSDTVSITIPNLAPVVQPIADVNVTIGTPVTVNISASDPGDIVTLSVQNLPSFATFTNNGGGNGLIQILAASIAGNYQITVLASDNHGAVTSVPVNITVSAVNNITKVLVNFNQTNPVALPWNSFNKAPTANAGLTNLRDDLNNETGINVTLLDAWTAHNTLGATTGNNSGVYPDEVMRTFYYYSGADTRRVRLSGLSANKKYDLTFFASRGSFATPLVTRYTVGAQSQDLNASNNISNTIKIEGLIPDANGEIIFTALKVSGAANSYLGSLVIESYDATTTTPSVISNLTATGSGTDRIQLKWSGIVNTTSYEVWRSTTSTGTFTKLADLPAGSVSYVNTGLSPATVFYYKVRAVVNSAFTEFSNVAGASTVSYTINLNLNDGTASAPSQSGNWNNLNALVSDGFVLPNLINTQGQPTGINWGVTKNFSGFNYFGTSTGNNSGVYPDNTMNNFYYLNYADTAKLRITGLTLAHSYNFIFFGSRVSPQVGVVTAYKIGSEVVTLNAANNTQNVAKISGVRPSADGSIEIVVYGTQQGGFGYLNVMSIEGAPVFESNTYSQNNQLIAGRSTGVQTGLSNATTAVNQTDKLAVDNEKSLSKAEIKVSLSAYPNPFVDDVQVEYVLGQDLTKFTVVLMDINGNIVQQLNLGNIKAGRYVQKLGLSGKNLPTGVYFVRCFSSELKNNKSLKVIKR